MRAAGEGTEAEARPKENRPPYMTQNQAAELYDVTTKTIRSWVHRHQVPKRRVGKYVILDTVALDEAAKKVQGSY